MKKKVAIWVVVILIIALLIGGVIMFLDDENSGVNPSISGDVSGDIDENVPTKIEEIEVFLKDKPLDYFNEAIMTKVPVSRIDTTTLGKYEDVQEFRLDEIDTKNQKWTCTIENPENISIDSGETEFLYSEYGVGTAVDRIYKIKGIKSGNSVIKMDGTFESSRGELIRQETVVYKISVDENLKVAITEELRYNFKDRGYDRDDQENTENNHQH